MAERVGSATVPPDVYPGLRVDAADRAAIYCRGGFFIAVPGMIFAVSMGDAFGGTHSYGMTAAILSIGIYALATLVLNAPYFPLRWSIGRMDRCISCCCRAWCRYS